MSEAEKLQIPTKIKRAATVIHLSLLVTVAYVFVIEAFTTETTFIGESTEIFMVGMFTMLFMVMIAFQIGFGKNWARLAFAIVFGFSVLSLYPILQANFKLNSVVGGLKILISALQLLAVFMLFSRDNTHYYRLKRERLMNEE
jgi:hypothetical protein